MVRELNTSESQPSVQEEIFNTLLRTPHRSVDQFLAIHREQLERDPFLYGCLATYAVHQGECAVRDIQDVFVATLFVSEFPAHREAAWCMFQDLPPHRARRVVQYITGYHQRLVHTSLDDPMPPNDQFGFHYERASYSTRHADKSKRGKEIPRRTQKLGRKLRKLLKTDAREMTVDTYFTSHEGHAKPMNRILRGAVTNYLTHREANESGIEGAILRSHNALRFLYAKAHLVPGGSSDHWLNRCLFHGEPREGSRIDALKKLIASKDPTEQAQIIVDARLPYPTIRSLIEKSPSTTIASITVMSDQELLANLGMLKRDGAFNNSEIKELIDSRIKGVQKAKRGKVDALKGEIAAAAVADLDEDTKKAVQDVTDTQLKKYGRIGVPTVLIIDKSSSMGQAIELGKQLGAAIGQAGGDNFVACYLFDYNPVRVRWTAADGDIGSYAAWNKKLEMFRCGGATNLGGVLRSMISENVRADQIAIITDEGENGQPEFHELLGEYKAKFGIMPEIVILQMGRHADYNRNKVVNNCKSVGASVSALDVSNIDKVSVPNVLQLLSKKSVFDLVQEILQLSLPTKEEWLVNQRAIDDARAKKKARKSKKSGQTATV